MWTWSLNWGDITPHIVIGTCPMTPDDVVRISEKTGVSALFSLQHDDCLAFWQIDDDTMRRTAEEINVVMARCPMRDFDIADMRKNLPGAISTLTRLITAGHRTYVHCTAGLGRAPLTVLGYLILIEKYPKQAAIRLLLNGRPEAVPAWEAFYGACYDLEAQYRESIRKHAYALYVSKANNDPLLDWKQAKSDIFKSELTALGCHPPENTPIDFTQ